MHQTSIAHLWPNLNQGLFPVLVHCGSPARVRIPMQVRTQITITVPRIENTQQVWTA
jgi:hypothetical protein